MAECLFFTVTDHNSYDACDDLQERYPDRFIPGVESTAYFPEDRTKIQILIYGLTRGEFEDVQRLRTNIYDLRGYIGERNLAFENLPVISYQRTHSENSFVTDSAAAASASAVKRKWKGPWNMRA